LIHYREVVDVTPIIQDNWDRQNLCDRRGFSPGRTLQHIAQVPPSVHHRWAKKVGFYEMDRAQKKVAMMKFLNEHPEYRTVKHIKTPEPYAGNIIIVKK
jgi:hypothetical protein